MKKRQQLVLRILRPRVEALGFNLKELRGIAAQIADNLSSAEDASSEDLNAEIETSVEAVIPFLRLGATYANRVINESRVSDDPDNDSDSDPSSSGSASRRRPKEKEEEPAWFRAYREGMEKRLSELQGARTADTRRARLEKMLADSGAFGKRTLRGFERMNFGSDEEFEQFCAEVEEDLQELNQERSAAGLALLGAPAIGGPAKKENEPEVLTQEQIKALAAM